MAKTPARRSAPHIAVIDGTPTTTSRDIAETFGKRHDDVLKRIRSLDCSPEFTARNFAASEYTDSTGRSLTEYRITRDGFAFLCMGFTGARAAQWKERYITTFNKMADRLAAKASRAPRVAAVGKTMPALPAPDLQAHISHGLPPAAALPPMLAAQVDAHAWQLADQARALLREHIARDLTHTTTADQRAHPGHPAVQNALASITLHSALAGPMRQAERQAVAFVRIAAHCTRRLLDEVTAQQAQGGAL